MNDTLSAMQLQALAVQRSQEVQQCAVCGLTENLMRCGNCRMVLYCGVEHQRQDWCRHSKVCGVDLSCVNNSHVEDSFVECSEIESSVECSQIDHSEHSFEVREACLDVSRTGFSSNVSPLLKKSESCISEKLREGLNASLLKFDESFQYECDEIKEEETQKSEAKKTESKCDEVKPKEGTQKSKADQSFQIDCDEIKEVKSQKSEPNQCHEQEPLEAEAEKILVEELKPKIQSKPKKSVVKQVIAKPKKSTLKKQIKRAPSRPKTKTARARDVIDNEYKPPYKKQKVQNVPAPVIMVPIPQKENFEMIGTWNTNMGTVIITGSEGCYGGGKDFCLANAEKYLRGISTKTGGRGRWKPKNPDAIVKVGKWNWEEKKYGPDFHGSFKWVLLDGKFTGTWGYGASFKNGGAWNGEKAIQRSNHSVIMNAVAHEAATKEDSSENEQSDDDEPSLAADDDEPSLTDYAAPYVGTVPKPRENVNFEDSSDDEPELNVNDEPDLNNNNSEDSDDEPELNVIDVDSKNMANSNNMDDSDDEPELNMKDDEPELNNNTSSGEPELNVNAPDSSVINLEDSDDEPELNVKDDEPALNSNIPSITKIDTVTAYKTKSSMPPQIHPKIGIETGDDEEESEYDVFSEDDEPELGLQNGEPALGMPNSGALISDIPSIDDIDLSKMVMPDFGLPPICDLHQKQAAFSSRRRCVD